MIWILWGHMVSEQRDIEERACAEQPSLLWNLSPGYTKASKGHVGTGGSKGIKLHVFHFHANSFLELVCLRLYLWPNILEVFLPHLSFPKRPSPVFSYYFVVVNHSLSARIFYVGA